MGPTVAIILLANALDLHRDLHPLLRLPGVTPWRMMFVSGVFLAICLLGLGAEMLVKAPDLRPDGLHGVLGPEILGLDAQPVLLLEPTQESDSPPSALYLGGTGEIHVLYDPCDQVAQIVASPTYRIQTVDEVVCPQ